MLLDEEQSAAAICKKRTYYFSPEHREKIRRSKLGLVKSAESRIKQSKTTVIDPWYVVNRATGESFCGYDLKGFCQKAGVKYKGMHRMAKGGRNHYKGWTIGSRSDVAELEGSPIS